MTESSKKQSEISQLSQEPGIRDLPSAVCRLYFAKALLAERAGNHKEADEFLTKAVNAEETAINNPRK